MSGNRDYYYRDGYWSFTYPGPFAFYPLPPTPPFAVWDGGARPDPYEPYGTTYQPTTSRTRRHCSLDPVTGHSQSTGAGEAQLDRHTERGAVGGDIHEQDDDVALPKSATGAETTPSTAVEPTHDQAVDRVGPHSPQGLFL